MPILVLPEDIASQIAAGEVVERPASVVKELLENALDAGARTVKIEARDAGRSLIEVVDDGVGVPAEELPIALARHATSKLTSAEDLFRIDSLGFRGEALASIGSVSRLTIRSRPAEAEIGARLHVDAGQLGEVEPVGSPPGTMVRVQSLFYNVPARLKFLKTDTTERRHIDDLVTRYALAYPDVRIQLTQDGREVVQSSGQGDRREILAQIYGSEVARQMLEVDAVHEDLRVSGFISPISLTRANRREITIFVNGRWVQDPALTAAITQAYRTYLMVGRYPLAVLFIGLPPERVDVNVHPAKAEVRFRDRDRVFAGVQRAVRRALLAHTPVPELSPDVRWRPPRSEARTETWRGERSWGLPGVDAPTEEEPTPQPTLTGGEIPLLRLVGQVGAAYLVAEGPDGLYLVDQHAAHERVLFERFMAQAEETVVSQTLLEPATVQLPPAQARLLEDQLPTLDRLGFQVEPFGPATFRVRGIPGVLSGLDPGAALRSLVEDFAEDETPLQAEREARLIARVCKRAAVKAGQALSEEEQRALLHDLERCEAPRTCPHGRPTMIHLSVDLLERQFGRRGSR